MDILRQVIFVSPVFDDAQTGPATYARYLWEGFGGDSQIEFHVVAPEFSGRHDRWHAAGRGTGSLDLYRRLAGTALNLAQALGGGQNNVLIHANNSNLHASLLAYAGPLWGQVNDYENADWWRRAGDTIRRAGWRRFLALGRRRWLERRFITRQELTLCNSNFTRQKIVAEYHPAHPERIITFPKAVEVGFYRRPSPAAGKAAGGLEAVRRFVFVGSDVVRKGLDTLLQAVALFPADFNWQLTVAGVSRAEVLAAFPHLPLVEGGAPIHFAGKLDRDALRQVLWAADVFVLPSRAEALGVALLEALAAGLTLVATDVGGIPEIIRHPEVGTLVPPGEPATLAQALLAARPRAPGDLPATVREILDYYSSSAMIARLRGLYLQAG